MGGCGDDAVPGRADVVGIAAVRQIQLDERRAAEEAGVPEGRLARTPGLAALGVDVRAARDQQAGDLDVFGAGAVRPDDAVQEGAAGGRRVRGQDPGCRQSRVAVEQGFRCGHVVPVGGHGQRQLRGDLLGGTGRETLSAVEGEPLHRDVPQPDRKQAFVRPRPLVVLDEGAQRQAEVRFTGNPRAVRTGSQQGHAADELERLTVGAGCESYGVASAARIQRFPYGSERTLLRSVAADLRIVVDVPVRTAMLDLHPCDTPRAFFGEVEVARLGDGDIPPAGLEDEPAAVRGPPGPDVPRGRVGQLNEGASRKRDGVQVERPLVAGGESDPAAIGRPRRVVAVLRQGGQPAHLAPGRGYRPQLGIPLLAVGVEGDPAAVRGPVRIPASQSLRIELSSVTPGRGDDPELIPTSRPGKDDLIAVRGPAGREGMRNDCVLILRDLDQAAFTGEGGHRPQVPAPAAVGGEEQFAAIGRPPRHAVVPQV